MPTSLNPHADPWSPVISKLPHFVYCPSYLHPPPTPFHHTIQLYNINFVHAPFHHPKQVYTPPCIVHEKMNVPQQNHSHWENMKVGTFERIFESHVPQPPRFETFTTSSDVTKSVENKVVKEDYGAYKVAEHVVDFGDDGGKTSIMIRNIPNKFRRCELLEFLDFYCVRNHLEYDFVYLPMDFRSHNNFGYAFVNFTTSSAAAKVMSILDGHMWRNSKSPLQMKTSKKICDMKWARIQGKEELVKHFQQVKFSCDESEYLPVVFSPPRNGSTSLSIPSTIGRWEGNPGNPPQKRRLGGNPLRKIR